MNERKWKDSGNKYDYVALQYQKRHVRKVIYAKQKQYYHDLFTNISRDSKRYMQKPIRYYSEKKPYHCQKMKTQNY